MDADDPVRRDDAFSVLRRFARRPAAGEQCELCSRAVAPEHPHLIEPAARRLLCVCDACAILFPGGHAKYKRVPRDIRYLRDFRLTDAQWDSLLIPIEMAFFYESSRPGRVVAVYPSPAGPTESLLPLETWNEVVADNPVLATLAPDVEALVANRANRWESGAATDPPARIGPTTTSCRSISATGSSASFASTGRDCRAGRRCGTRSPASSTS